MDPISIALALAKVTGIGDLIGKKLGGDRGAAIAGKVIDVAQAITGTTEPQSALDTMLDNPELAHQYRVKLLELYEAEMHIEAEDRASARTREVSIATNEHAPLFVKLVPSLLSVGVVLLSFALFAALIFGDVDKQNQNVIVYVLGVLSGAIGQIMSYHFGSTKGSESKNKAIEDLARKS